MPICPICDDTGLQNSDSTHPEFCFCAAGKHERRRWEASHGKGKLPKPASFIDIANLEQVNANVDAMRSSLLGSVKDESETPAKHPALQMLYQVAHAGHQVSMSEATQLYDLAKALEGFLENLTPIGRNPKR